MYCLCCVIYNINILCSVEDNALSISNEENCSLETRSLFVFSTREQSLCHVSRMWIKGEEDFSGVVVGGGVIFLVNSANCVISEDTNCRQNNH